jgi:hypothetical protein
MKQEFNRAHLQGVVLSEGATLRCRLDKLHLEAAVLSGAYGAYRALMVIRGPGERGHPGNDDICLVGPSSCR